MSKNVNVPTTKFSKTNINETKGDFFLTLNLLHIILCVIKYKLWKKIFLYFRCWYNSICWIS